MTLLFYLSLLSLTTKQLVLVFEMPSFDLAKAIFAIPKQLVLLYEIISFGAEGDTHAHSSSVPLCLCVLFCLSSYHGGARALKLVDFSARLRIISRLFRIFASY